MKKCGFTPLLLFCALQILSQEYPREFGKISTEEVSLASYSEDPEAEALVLFDIGKSKFIKTESGFDILFSQTRRIKILEQAGMEYAEVAIPLYVSDNGTSEKVESLEAFTYNLENSGIIRKQLDEKTVYEEKKSDHWKVKKFAFPDARAGSVVEYRYEVRTPFLYHLRDWSFQDHIPTLYSRYTVNMIPFYEYVLIVRGTSKFDFQESKKGKLKRYFSGVEFVDMIYDYAMTDVPAFRDESYITSPDDYMIKMDFQLAKITRPNGVPTEIMSTWPKLVKDLDEYEDFGRYIDKCRKTARNILETDLDVSGLNTFEKARKIIDYVKSGFGWNGYYNKFASKKPKELISQRTGNSADINLMLLALLRAAGIQADPVILSTRNHRKITVDYPFEHFFNYVVVLVNADGNQFLTDGTGDMLTFNTLPPRCLNDPGLVVDKKETRWVQFSNATESLKRTFLHHKLNNASNSYKITGSITSTHYEAYHYRKTFKNDTTKALEEILNKGVANVDAIRIANANEGSRPYSIFFSGDAQAENLGGKIVVSSFLGFPLQENKLKQKERQYPVDFIYTKAEELKAIIDFPEELSVSYLPENYVVDDDLVEIRVTHTENKQQIVTSALFRLKKPVYLSEEYQKIKAHFDMVTKKFNESIVFEM